MKKAEKNILLAFLLNFIFVLIELVGGLLTNSIAILSDSIHDFGDSLALGSAYVFERKSNKEPNNAYTYGYKRYSIISALITSVVLLIGGIIVIYSSIERLINPQNVYGLGMLIIAIIGVAINGIAVIRTAKAENLNEKSINLHMLEDVLGWIVVLIGSVFVAVFGWTFLDPIISIFVSVFILFNVVKNIISAFSIMLEKTPKDFPIDKLKQEILGVENIKSIHHLHVWTLDGGSNLATVHVVINDDLAKEKIIQLKHSVKEECEEFNIKHLTIQIDRESEACEDCECKINQEKCDVCSHHHHHH